jgi:hypothetical protein
MFFSQTFFAFDEEKMIDLCFQVEKGSKVATAFFVNKKGYL